jgi:hypothetical protein
MLERMSSRHLTEWNELFRLKAEEAEDGDDPDDSVGLFESTGMGVHAGDRAAPDDDEDDEDVDDDDD